MRYSRNNQLSARLLAIAAIVLTPAAADAATAGDISAAQVLNTSALYADAASAIACTVTNVSTATINVTITGVSASGSALFSNSFTIPAGQIQVLQTAQGAVGGFARCRFTLNYGADNVRANITLLHTPDGGSTFQTYAISEAR